MKRYIDADKLWNDRPQIPEGKSMDFGAGFSECMWGFSRNIRKQIDTESADVVPKSEVDKARQNGYELGKRQVAMDIFRRINRVKDDLKHLSGLNFPLRILIERIELLEQIYTEGQDNQ